VTTIPTYDAYNENIKFVVKKQKKKIPFGDSPNWLKEPQKMLNESIELQNSNWNSNWRLWSRMGNRSVNPPAPSKPLSPNITTLNNSLSIS